MGISVYEIVTNQIIETLEKGVVPWRKPWNSGMPINIASKKPYRGVNVFLLGSQNYNSNVWGSYKQFADKKFQVRKGEKGTPCVFWKTGETEKDGKTEKFFMLRYYSVFNSEQTDMPTETHIQEFNNIEACEDIISKYSGPTIEHSGDKAIYSPALDLIRMPLKTSFHSEANYYATLFHELIHSTGHESRLKREGVVNFDRFGSHQYSAEELIAECGSAFLCGHTGILNNTIENSAAYISHWSQLLKQNPKWLVEASSKAAKAVDLIMGL